MSIESVTPLIIPKKEKLTIGEIASLVISFYKKLASVDSGYNHLSIVSEKKSLYQSMDIHDVEATEFLVEEIIHQNIDEIRKISDVDSVDHSFSWDRPIQFALEPAEDPKLLMILSYAFHTEIRSIAPIIVNEECLDSYSKARWFLDAARESFSVDRSVIKVSTRDFRAVSRKYRAPLGWINYFSDDSEWQIPDDLEGIEYEKVEGGKYLIVSRENIGSSPDQFEAAAKKLARLMEDLGDRVPRYKK